MNLVMILGFDISAQKLILCGKACFIVRNCCRFIDLFRIPFAAFEHESTHACVEHLA